MPEVSYDLNVIEDYKKCNLAYGIRFVFNSFNPKPYMDYFLEVVVKELVIYESI